MSNLLRILCVACLIIILLGAFAPHLLESLRPASWSPQSNTPSTSGDPSEGGDAQESGSMTIRPSANSPMIEALGSVIEQQTGTLGEAGTELQNDLARADAVLKESKERNRDAIRQASRRIRLPGRSPHFLLIMVHGLTTESLHCYNGDAAQTPGFDGLASRGARLLEFDPESSSDTRFWTSLLDGSLAPNDTRSQSFVTALWQSGYDTFFAGDASSLPVGNPSTLNFDNWFGFRTEAEALNRFPDFVWDNGRRRDLKTSLMKKGSNEPATRKPMHFVLLEEATDRMASPAQSRPLLSIISLRTDQWTPQERDDIPAVLEVLLNRKRLASSTLVMVAGLPSSGRHESITPASQPFVVAWPSRIANGITPETRTTWGDVAATLCEVAEVSPRGLSLRGTSLWKELSTSPRSRTTSERQTRKGIQRTESSQPEQ